MLHSLVRKSLHLSLGKVRQFNCRNGRSFSLGLARDTHILKHVWTCSNLRLHELQTKRYVRFEAAEEVIRVHVILLAGKTSDKNL
jgi:hypothetical protein